jgi:hypothetical protein
MAEVVCSVMDNKGANLTTWMLDVSDCTQSFGAERCLLGYAGDGNCPDYTRLLAGFLVSRCICNTIGASRKYFHLISSCNVMGSCLRRLKVC